MFIHQKGYNNFWQWWWWAGYQWVPCHENSIHRDKVKRFSFAALDQRIIFFLLLESFKCCSSNCLSHTFYSKWLLSSCSAIKVWLIECCSDVCPSSSFSISVEDIWSYVKYCLGLRHRPHSVWLQDGQLLSSGGFCLVTTVSLETLFGPLEMVAYAYYLFYCTSFNNMCSLFSPSLCEMCECMNQPHNHRGFRFFMSCCWSKICSMKLLPSVGNEVSQIIRFPVNESSH